MSDPAPRSSRPNPVWWVIALSLAAIAVNMWAGPIAQPIPAFAQSQGGGSAGGVIAFPTQLTPNTFGIFMVDVDRGNLWCYEYSGAGNGKKLRLAAARSWLFDRYLENFGTGAPSPDEVEALVSQQRARRAARKTANPTGTP